jgi:type I restriction enzyme, S subunit
MLDGWVEEELHEITDFIGRGRSPSYVDISEFPILNQACIQNTGIDLEKQKYVSKAFFESLDHFRKAKVGDILVNSTGTGTLGRIGIWKAKHTIAFDSHLTLVRVQQMHCPDFFYYQLRSSNSQQWIENHCISGSTNQIELSRTAFQKLKVKFPRSKEVQIKIAEILSTIDHALEQTQALIAKYQRMKTGLMQDLLTRGIDEQGRLRDPSTHEFKDSRLGRIPVGWDVKTLAQIVPFHRPIVYGILMPGTGHENGIPVVKVKDIYDGEIHTDGLLLTSPKIHDAFKRSQIQTGDLLFTIRGTVGRMAFVPEIINGGNITQDTARVSIIGVNPEFVRSYLDMPIPRAFIELHTVGQAVQGINLEHVRQILVALPPREEQDKISERLDAHRLTMNNLGNEVKKLETLKAGLMQDLLSGKKSVASLLEQTGTLETPDTLEAATS